MSTSPRPERESPFLPELPPWYDLAPSDTDPASLTEKQLKEITEEAFLRIKRVFENYEPREAQVEMSFQTLRAFYLEKTAIIEAGTGIGKSFAYLVSALAFSYLRGKRVLITTETKNLQMQIFEKDIVLLQKALDPTLNFGLCLGSNNYLCKLRFEETYQEGGFLELVSKKQARDFQEWAKDVFENDREGNFYSAPGFVPFHFWSLVNRNSDGCPASKCSHYNECNYFRTRLGWQKNRIMVGNHHLLLFHLQNEKNLLPEYGALVVDEAHSFLSSAYSIFSLGFRVNSLADQKKNVEKKLLPKASAKMKKKLKKNWENTEKLWNVFFSFWQNHLDLLFVENENKMITEEAEIETEEIKGSITELKAILSKEFSEETDAVILNHYSAVVKLLSRLMSFIDSFGNMNFDKNVYWASMERNVFSLHTCFIELGDELEELFQEPQLWTSATLGYWGGGRPPPDKYQVIEAGYFDGFQKSILPSAIEPDDLLRDIFKSTFPYREKTAMYIPKALTPPEWGAETHQQEKYENSLLDEIAYLVQLSKGGVLVLFTSYYLLNLMTTGLRELVEEPIYSQAELGAHKALEFFKKDTNAVLLGTNSFWQGVDIPGKGLRMLIITRLMFQPPDDPIFKARAEKIKQRQGNHFSELALPYTSRMLRQGFGRLIRNHSDQGVVAILDSRIVRKNYGKTLLVNLPRMEIASDREDLERLVEAKQVI